MQLLWDWEFTELVMLGKVLISQPRTVKLRAYLHGTTLSHATSLRQAYDMTQDHLHAHDICQNLLQFHSGGLGIARNKMADVQQVSVAVIVAIICKRRKKKRMVKEVWERERLIRRTERGVYGQLLEDLRL